ncbi:hypothetical protein F7731_14700 [Cytobacillus depressus]|uniref:Uncharacterized protein n=1 Tax=Cytobacillus depressus TaxID=1602942 RepID=A0A6L3V357_9BACI|nr:hypothetical protein [Cytobacillus depressus]KAB2334461.1 hypothetical protein F7731_14700 [Cytobacillus depressus]
MKTKALFILLPVIMIFTLLWQVGLIGLWTKGIAYIANDTKGFTDSNSHIIEGNYSVSIDLSNLESNIGKELYNDGTHKINVFWIVHLIITDLYKNIWSKK